MKKVATLAVLLCLIVALVITSCSQSTPAPSPAASPATTPKASPTATAPKTIKWICQNVVVGPAEWGKYSGMGQYWADFINKASNGRLVVEVKPPESVVATKELFTNIGKGTVDVAAQYYGGYHTAIMPEANIEIGPPFSWETADEQIDCYLRYGFLKEFQDLYAKNNIYYIPSFGGMLYTLHTNFPIPNPDALKGKKIRALGIYGEWIKALGGSPVAMPWADVYMALKLGTIDGCILSSDALETAKLQEVVTHILLPPNLASPVSNMIFNMDAIKALPDDLRALVTESTMHVCNTFSTGANLAMYRYVGNAERNYGLKRAAWTGADLDKARNAAFTLWDSSLATASPKSAELIKILKQQMKDLGKLK